MPRPAGALGVVQVARRVVLTASARRLPAATAAALLLGGQALLVIAGEAATSPGRRRGLARGHGQLHARVPGRRRVRAHRRAAAPGGRPRPPPGRGQLAGGWREQRGHAFQWPGHQPARRIFPHGGRRDHHAELRQLAMDPAVSPQRILPCQPNDQAADVRGRRRAAGLAPLACGVLAASELAVPGQERRGRTGKTSVQRLLGRTRASAASHTRSPGSYRIRPTFRRSTAFSCRSTSSSASFARSPRNTRMAKPSTRRVSR